LVLGYLLQVVNWKFWKV